MLDLQDSLQQKILRAFFGSLAGVCVLGAVVAPLLGGPQTLAVRVLMVVGYSLVAAMALAALRAPPAAALRWVGPVTIGGFLQVGLVGAGTGWGLQTPGLAFFAVAVGLAHVVVSARLGRALLATALGVLVALALGERLGWLPAPAGIPPLGSRLVIPCVALITSALVGRAAATLMQQHLAVAGARERRFRTLLGIATSCYWETDAQHRFSQASGRDRHGAFQSLPAMLGRVPWATPAVQVEGGDDGSLLDTMQAHQPLTDLPVRWQGPRGGQRHFLISGEPRHDAQGRFVGYWGVAREVTAERRAQAAQQALETRYQDLFKHVPLALMLHRDGVVVDANPAAAALLGYDNAAGLLGVNLPLAHQDEGREAAQARIAAMASLLPGQAAPPATLAARTREGRNLTLTVIATRTVTPEGPAILAIAIDETERQQATLALQRSQALLAKVVSMSPDIIALTDLPGGRYVMANESFTRLLGHETADLVGRSALDLGLWRDPAQRLALARDIAEHGTVRDRLVEMVAKDGRVVPLMMSVTTLRNDDRDYALSNSRDLSEAMRARLEREAILANASVGIAFTRAQRFEMANGQFEAMFGWPAGGLIGQPGRVVWASDAEYEALGQEIGPLLARGEPVDIERSAKRLDGTQFRMRLRAKAIDPRHPAESGTIWIAEDVTAARQAEADLARARDAAEAASRAKSAFLANTSHEIRTPLNGLTGLARLARQPGVPPERLNAYLVQIGESADQLSHIIADILDVAKIEAGKLALEQAPFDLAALLQSLQGAYGALAASHGLRFEAQIEPDLPPWVQGDALRVRQILVNFLHNALKFTAQGHLCLVARRGEGDLLHFEVQDSGPGIDAATQARLFMPFTQADESTTRRFGGTGLGLSICRELATLMGGRVSLHSVPGQGSRFFAELPLPPAAPPEACGDDAESGDPRLRGARVLLVEDNSVNMMIGVALLSHWGIAVSEATDGPRALAAAAHARADGQPFDAVLMDLQMPGMSGYETTGLLRQQPGAAALPVIALTAAALVSERERALAIGMDDFLTKPIDPQRLHAALLRAVLRTPALPGR